MTPPAPTPEEQAIQIDAEFWQLPLGTDQEWASDWLIDRMTEALAAAHARGREEALEALEHADEALDFAVGALGDAVERELDRAAGYAVIRMAKDARRLYTTPALRALRRPPSPREEGNTR